MTTKDNPPTTQEMFFRPFFKRLGELNGQYCVLHTYETLPYYAEGDVDIAVHGIDITAIEQMLCSLCNDIGWSITQRLWYDIPVCLYYVVQPNNRSDTNVKVDFLFDPDGLGYTCYTTRFLTSQPVNTSVLLHSNPTVEFCYKLTKRIRKGFFRPEDPETLISLYKHSDRRIVRSELVRQFGASWANSILNIFDCPDEFNVDLLSIKALAKSQSRRCNYSSLTRLIKKIYWQIYRHVNRIFHPCGLVILLPCSDHKTIENVQNLLPGNVKHPFRYVHLRRKINLLDRFRALSGSTLLIANSYLNNDEIRIYDRHYLPAKRLKVKYDLSGNLENEAIIASEIGLTIMKLLIIRTQKRICH